MLVYSPGWSLASQFWSYTPPPKKILALPRPQNEKSGGKLKLLFLKKSGQNGGFCFGFFLIHSVTRISTLANNKRSLPHPPSAQKEIFKSKLRVFFRRNCFVSYCHSYLEPRLSRTSDPSRLLWPRPIDCNRGSEQPEKIIPLCFCSIIAKKKLFYVLSDTIYTTTPQKKPIAGFSWPGDQYSRDKCWQKNKASGGGQLVLTVWRTAKKSQLGW